MKYDNKDLLRKKCVELYLDGKSMSEISKVVNCSRNYVGQLLKNTKEVIQYRNKSKVKVFKYKSINKMTVPISVNFLNKIGISKDVNVAEYVDVSVDDKKKEIIIRKHEI